MLPVSLNWPAIIPFLFIPVNNWPTAGTTLMILEIIFIGAIEPVNSIFLLFKLYVPFKKILSVSLLIKI